MITKLVATIDVTNGVRGKICVFQMFSYFKLGYLKTMFFITWVTLFPMSSRITSLFYFPVICISVGNYCAGN